MHMHRLGRRLVHARPPHHRLLAEPDLDHLGDMCTCVKILPLYFSIIAGPRMMRPSLDTLQSGAQVQKLATPSRLLLRPAQ